MARDTRPYRQQHAAKLEVENFLEIGRGRPGVLAGRSAWNPWRWRRAPQSVERPWLISFAGTEKWRAVFGQVIDQGAPDQPYQGCKPESDQQAER